MTWLTVTHSFAYKLSASYQVLRLLKNPTDALLEIHRAYGDWVPVKLFNNHLIFVTDPAAIEEIFALEAKGSLSHDFLYDAKKLLFGEGIINSKKDLWLDQRRLLQTLFTRDAIKSWENIIIEEADRFANTVSESMPLDLTASLQQTIQRLFSRIMFGKKPEHDCHGPHLSELFTKISRGLVPHIITEVIGVPFLKKLFFLNQRQLKKSVGQFKQLVDKEVQDNLRNKEPSCTLFSLLRQMYSANTVFRMKESLLRDEIVNLFFAGQDTTVNTLNWFFYSIGRNKRVHEIVTREILQYAETPLSAANLQQLKYTKAALYETLRLYPPASAVALQGIEHVLIQGNVVPKNTTLIISVYVCQRNKKTWQKPDSFYPERFLDDKGAKERGRYAFFPFGSGLHNCLGRHLAELEMMLIITCLLRRFSVRVIHDVKPSVDIILKPSKNILAHLQPLKVV